MIAVDTNILVYSHRRDSEFHPAAAAKVRELAEGRAPWALPWPCLHEFFSIVTHPRIYDPPSRADLAIDQIGRHVRQPIVVAFRQTIFDSNVLALDISRFLQALAERWHTGR